MQHLQATDNTDPNLNDSLQAYPSKGPQPNSNLAPARETASAEQQDTGHYSMAGASTEQKVVLEDDKAVVVGMSGASQADANYSMVGGNGFKELPPKVLPYAGKKNDAPSIPSSASPAENTYDCAIVKPDPDANLRFDVDDLDRKLNGEPPLDRPPELGADPNAVYSAPILKRSVPAVDTPRTGEDLYSHANPTANYRFIAPSNVEMKEIVAAG